MVGRRWERCALGVGPALAAWVGCGSPDPAPGADGEATQPPDTGNSTSASPTTGNATRGEASNGESASSAGPGSSDSSAGGPQAVLEVRFLGVGGFAWRVGGDQVLSAPLYTNPAFIDVNFGQIAPDPALIDRFLDAAFVADAKAIVVGHAHYDHLMDVAHVWTKTADATVYGNASARNLLAGFAQPPAARVVALNDPARPLVDRRSCAEPDICTSVAAGSEGQWVSVPGTDVRLRGLCSSHPAQFLGIHFAEGCVSAAVDSPPTDGELWREGATLAYLIDFLDPQTGAPQFRIYYQDTPTDAPVGHPAAELLAERRVDLAVVNVGSWESVGAHPHEIIEALDPRFVLGGHWEDFFQPQSEPIQPIPFLADPAEFDAIAVGLLGPDGDAEVLVDGEPDQGRYWRPVPGTDFVFPPPP